MAKAMTDMYRKMSELGVPFATEMKIGMEGEGPMAEADEEDGPRSRRKSRPSRPRRFRRTRSMPAG